MKLQQDFTPLLKTPTIETDLGEDDATEIFKAPCTLYRFDQTEWKERGTGDIRIMRHQHKKSIRVIMRRNIVKKLCANHYLTQNQTLLAQIRSPNTWIWYATDFSDPSL